MSTERKLFFVLAFVALAIVAAHALVEKLVFVVNLRGVLVTEYISGADCEARAGGNQQRVKVSAAGIAAGRGATPLSVALNSQLSALGFV